MAETASRPQRRLPTKTRSGIITLPPASGPTGGEAPGALPSLSSLGTQLKDELEEDLTYPDDEELLQRMASKSAMAGGNACKAQTTAAEPCPQSPRLASALSPASKQVAAAELEVVPGPGRSQGSGVRWADGPAQPNGAQPPIAPTSPTTPIQSLSVPASEPGGVGSACSSPEKIEVASSEAPAGPSAVSGVPPMKPPLRPGVVKAGGKTVTGPLNSSTSPQVVSLPVKRRGSYQSLKKNVTSHSDDQPSVLALVKKLTHWEKFGTILVLYCSSSQNPQGADGGVLQMMLAEGYDTDVVDNQAAALSAFNAKEVYPDIVLIDADHSYNTIQMIKQVQTQNPTVAIIILGSAQTRPGPISALQAGAADYIRKPPDVDELMARIERHVQRQHCIKLGLEHALEQVKLLLAQAPVPAAAAASAAPVGVKGSPSRHGLGAVEETDFEEQMSELCDENARLASRLRELELRLAAKETENKQLEVALRSMDGGDDGYGKTLIQVESESDALV